MKTTTSPRIPEPADTAGLIRFLVEENHKQLKEWLSSLGVHINTSAKVDRHRHPESTIIARCFSELRSLLEQHLWKEEMFIFPVLSKIAEEEQGYIADVLLARKPVRELKEDHKKMADLLLKIRVISDNCHADVNSSPSLKEFCWEFRDFELCLKEHLEIVESRLFSKIEKTLERISKRNQFKTR